MSKLTKLIHHPFDFIFDSYVYRFLRNTVSGYRSPSSTAFFLKNPLKGSKNISSTTTNTSAEPTKVKEHHPDKNTEALPSWYLTQLDYGIPVNKVSFLYIPWIPEHGEALVNKLRAQSDLFFYPLHLIERSHDPAIRRDVSRFAREQPDRWRKLALRRLAPMASKISGVVLSFDWHPVMREIAYACRSLGIPTILIPHESVFMDENKYYVSSDGVNRPITDFALVWGHLQERIFNDRGYPSDRIKITGSPKFDTHPNYKPLLTREAFAGLYGLDPALPILLYAAQPLDMQTQDQKWALKRQEEAIADVLDYAEARGIQAIVRLPPSGIKGLRSSLAKRINNSSLLSSDGPGIFLAPAEEAIYHSAVVISINSTMLFEAALMARPALSSRYIPFEQIWTKVGIPAAENRSDIFLCLDAALSGDLPPWTKHGAQWAASELAAGDFDGLAGTRVSNELKRIATRPREEILRSSAALELILNENAKSGVIHLPSAGGIRGAQAFVMGMLGAQSFTTGKSPKEAAAADVFVQWGITPNKSKENSEVVRRALGRSRLFIEDGFLRSVDIGLSKEPGLSIILDDRTAYYDATRPSRLIERLNNPRELTLTERQRAENAIKLITDYRVSKYNHAPIARLTIGRPEKGKILLIDQRFGDQSIVSGLSSENSFSNMLSDALERNQEFDILIKRHPDAIKGEKQSYFSDDRVGFLKHVPNFYLIDFDINPYSLFEIVNEVWVTTSGAGFEALMAEKSVRCYGAPFYAGWGLTDDRIAVPHRVRKRTLEDIFHVAYIEFSRYWDPVNQCRCSLELTIKTLANRREGVAAITHSLAAE